MKIYYYVLVGILFVGCASTPLDTRKNDKEAKQFTTDKNKANIYIYRDADLPGSPRLTIMFNQYIAGDTTPKTYLRLKVIPGKHTIKSIFGNVSTIVINTKASRNYFIWQETKMGMVSGQTKLHLVESEEGKRKVLESKLSLSHMMKNTKLK